jgi:phosphoenolpyruvate carboxylase
MNMDHKSTAALQQFRNLVGIQFQLYNSLFTSLPFHRIEKTGIMLSLLLTNCEEGYRKKLSPVEILDEFFSKHTSYGTEAERMDLLFRFVQYAERQVVLFDALEDAAFKHIHDMNGTGTLRHLESEVEQTGKVHALAEKLKDFSIRLVLTAHPTQFYPGSVLGIINDLSKALKENDTVLINMYLQQLGKTPFFKKQKPTPYDEAVSLIWYLENVFYNASGKIISFMKKQFPDAVNEHNPIIKMGFWPGGDRDGNPFVTAPVTTQVADALRSSIIKCYYTEVRRLKRRLTFEGVEQPLSDLEKKLYNNIFIPGQRTNLNVKEMLQTLNRLRETIIYKHNGLFVHLIESLISKVEVFGLHFASLDVRQESTVHGNVLAAIADKTNALPAAYTTLGNDEKIKALTSVTAAVDETKLEAIEQDTIVTIKNIKTIQQTSGEAGCNRYIISQCNSALNVMEVYGLFLLSGWSSSEMNIDIVPLFETVDDLQNAETIMHTLYNNDAYKKHLHKRRNKQTIMLGFSDGTKDGGYLMANWSIYKAKEELTRISKEYAIDVVFFDGRGGPPSRGGGKTHKFYASMGKNISNKEIQLTIQGQTVSSNFGTIDSAQYNIEQLLHAGISNDVFPRSVMLNKEQEVLIQQLAEAGYQKYISLKNHPYFVDYLSHVSPLRFYSETNIGSRPAKRGGSKKLTLKDLRAIPFVGSWSQIKQNLAGYYGVGSALKALEQQGKFSEIKKLYKESLFFRTLLDNCEMAMMKCFFPLTNYLRNHPQFGEIWENIYAEYELTKEYVLKLGDKTELMADYPVEQLSIQMRERIVLPLITIQQYALTKVRETEEALIDDAKKATYGKLVMRCSFGIINAGRNSA